MLYVSVVMYLSKSSLNFQLQSVTDATDCLSGDAIDIYDNDYYFQGIITNVGADYINFTPELDYSFEAGSIAKCGEWNLNSDGSTTPVEYTINPPLERSWDIESIGMQFQDNLDWDISTFGSRSALTNGFVVAVGDGDIKNLFLVYNNGGFLLRGGTIQDVAKAPAGLYGFSVDMEFETKYGSVLKLDGTLNESLRAINQDDLTSQTQIAFTVRGHYKDA